MTKQNEIHVLNSAIELLGGDSYLGPWLKSVKAEVESMVISDTFPDVSLKDASEQCEEMIGQATVKTAGIVKQAESEASRMIEKAQDRAASITRRTADHLRTALRAID